MQIIKTLTFFVLILSNINVAVAQNYQVVGQAPITKDYDNARAQALDKAVMDTVRFSGGSLAAFNTIRQHLNNNQDEYYFRGSEIQSIRVVKENKLEALLTKTAKITVLINMTPVANACHFTQYKKPLLIGTFKLEDPKQASLGRIYDIGEDFSNVLVKTLNQFSQSFTVIGTTKVNFSSDTPQKTIMLAQDNNTQYLVSGKITDIPAMLDTKTNTVTRHFAVEIDVLDGRNGVNVASRIYRDYAIWPFSKTSIVDTKTARFWGSSYGLMLRNVAEKIVLDLESVLSCKITLPEIIAIHGDKMQVNAGSVHGLKQGDQLNIWHQASYIDQNGTPRAQYNMSESTATVTQVYTNNADIVLNQPEYIGSVQIGDLLGRHTNAQ